MGHLKHDLIEGGGELIETHTAWVFLRGDSVIKVKKPVNFGFLDFSTLEARRKACQAEVRLNARLAAQVYQGVVRVTTDAQGHHQVDGDGETVDYAVSMQRLPDERRADLLLEHGELDERHIEMVALTLAEFHERMPTGASVARFGVPHVMLENVEENFAQTSATITDHITSDEALEIKQRQLEFLAVKRDLLIQRVLGGRIRDGHGDLRLEHVYFDDEQPPTIIDCIEFNDRFRYADVCADIAFLSMDLARLGRVDLAERFLAAYARESNDFDLYPLVDFYEGYRAFVRAKVASLLQADPSVALESRQRAKVEARRHYLLALSSGRAALLEPALICVGGVIGAGKSTVSEIVARQLSAPVVGSDRTRKSLLGLDATTSAKAQDFKGAYGPGFTERVYSEVLRRAASVLSSGRPVVIDASFRSRDFRQQASLLAASYGVPYYFVECRASRELCRQRLEQRTAGNVSDARAELLDQFIAGFEPTTELEAAQHVVLDTAQPVAKSQSVLRQSLPAWPAGLNG